MKSRPAKLAALVAVLVTSVAAYSQVPGFPRYLGIVHLHMKNGQCRAGASSVRVDLGSADTGAQSAYWLVFGECGDEVKSVKVGMTRDRKAEKEHEKLTGQKVEKYYDVLDCDGRVETGPAKVGLIHCVVKSKCGGGDKYRSFSYSVCSTSDALSDPDLRVKGGGRLYPDDPADPCPEWKIDEAKKACIG
ncbi:MAG: hypothetical protein U0599_09915 [Vicinamibacteria bacterium]